MNRLPKIALAVLAAAASVMTLSAQLPIPVSGQNPAQGGGPAGAPAGPAGAGGVGRGGRGGGRGAQTAPPVKQGAAPIPSVVEVTGPGEFYETFMDDHDDTKN